jgi:hypothetical protein
MYSDTMTVCPGSILGLMFTQKLMEYLDLAP